MKNFSHIDFKTQLNILSKLLAAVCIVVISLQSEAQERVGKIEVDEVLLKPMLVTIEEVGGEFDLTDSLFSLRWYKDKNISAYLAVSSTLNRNLPIYYTAENKDEVGFYKAYAQYQGLYGRIRLGLIPLNYAYDGEIEPREQIFTDAQLFAQRIIGYSDYGLSLYTSHNGYFTELLLHNGEIDTESDGRLFATGHWGWTDDRRWTSKLSLQTGSVQEEVSTGSTNTIAGVDNDKGAQWRHGAFHINYHPRGWNALIELGRGEVEQDKYTGAYSYWIFELTSMIDRNWGIGIRFDEFDPHRHTEGDKITKAHVAAVLRSRDSTSNLYLVGTKVSEQANEISNDELRLVWLVTPFAK